MNLNTLEDGQDVSEVHYNDACDGDTDCADDNDREDDNMSHHLPLLIQLLNLNTLERADLGMYRRLLDITKEDEEEEEEKDKDEEESVIKMYQSGCFNL